MIIPFFYTYVFMFEVIEPDVFFLFVGFSFLFLRLLSLAGVRVFLGREKSRRFVHVLCLPSYI